MKPKKLAAITMLTAISIGTNYAMAPFFNVKLMDLIVFIGGFCFGPIAGMFVGVVSWAVYGSFNPLGFSLPIWLSTMLAETIYGVAGGLAGKTMNSRKEMSCKSQGFSVYVFFAAIGMLLTFAYDVITNIVFGYVSGWSIVFAIVIGFVPFGLVHVISNAAFFGLGCIPGIKVITKIIGGKCVVAPEK